MKTHEVVNDLGIVWKIIKCTFHFTWTFSFRQFPSVQFSVLEVGLKFFDTHCRYIIKNDNKWPIKVHTVIDKDKTERYYGNKYNNPQVDLVEIIENYQDYNGCAYVRLKFQGFHAFHACALHILT